MRILHLADVHLDTLFTGRSEELRSRLREASREAFRRALRLAVDRRLDAVLVAGDLFDGERLSFQTEGFLQEELGELEEARIPFLYATGNHDPGEGLPGTARLRWPRNVTLFGTGEPATVEIRREGEPVGRVTAAGHATGREEQDLSAAFPRPEEDGLPHVAMLHTQVTGAGGAQEHDRYAPSELPRLRASGFDYWALGHIHLRQELSALPGIHFPGNLQGRNPRESGAKGGLVVEITARGAPPRVEFVELAPVRWEVLEVSGLEPAERLGSLMEAVERGWKARRAEDPGLPGGEWVVRVVLSGPSPLHSQLRDREERLFLERELARTLGALEVEVRVEGVRPALDPAGYLERQDAAGEALRLVGRLAEDPALVPQRELALGTGDLAGAPGDPTSEELAAYLRELLQDGDRTLLERFREGRGGGGSRR